MKVSILIFLVYSTLLLGCRKLAETPRENCFIPYVDFVAYNVNPHTLEVNFTSVTSYNGVITSHHWDFGDGTSYNGENPPPHKYPPQTASSSTSTYTIKYTVKNDCGEAFWTHDIKIGKCLPDVHFSFVLVNDSTVRFTNTTQSPTPATYQWDFGDSTKSSSGASSVTKVYAYDGKYTVSLKAANDCGDNYFIATVPVCSKPVPAQKFTVSGCSTVNLDASATRKGEKYQWDFGNGTILPAVPSGSPTISYTYPRPGAYQVTLKVINKNGCDSATLSTPVKIESIGLVPNNHWNYQSNDLDFSFSREAVVNATAYSWDFGDGTTASVQNPGTKTFANPGFYTITLTASNGCGDYTFTAALNVPAYRFLPTEPPTGFQDVDVSAAGEIYYLGTNGKLYRTDTAGNWSPGIALPSSLRFGSNTRLFRDIHNDLWVYGKGDIAKFNPSSDSWTSYLSLINYNSNTTITGMTLDANGALWTVAGKEVRRNSTRISGKGNIQYSSMAFAPATGRIWITAANQNDLYYVNMNGTELTPINGAAISNGGAEIKVHPDGDIYFTQNTGITRANGSGTLVTNYTASTTNGLLSGAARDFEFDRKGNMWVIYAGRLVRIPLNGGPAKNYSFTNDLMNLSAVAVLYYSDNDSDLLLAKNTNNGAIQIK